MKIYLANSSKQATGGGWSWIANFRKGMGDQITSDYNVADIYLIPSPTMVSREEVQQAKADGKKVVLRLDNAVRNSRNRNTGMTRMKDFAEWADLVVYQSQWAKDYLMSYLGRDGAVILNGTDLELFKLTEIRSGDNVLYSRFNRDDSKNVEAARYWYSEYQLLSPEAKLYLVGQFSDELREGNFDFYNGERFEYLGVLDARNMAKVYAACGKFLYTYFNDCASQSLCEALVSGCEIVGDDYYRSTGGAPEIISAFSNGGREALGLERMCDEYRRVLSDL